jgi:hypothetical protein
MVRRPCSLLGTSGFDAAGSRTGERILRGVARRLRMNTLELVSRRCTVVRLTAAVFRVASGAPSCPFDDVVCRCGSSTPGRRHHLRAR